MIPEACGAGGIGQELNAAPVDIRVFCRMEETDILAQRFPPADFENEANYRIVNLD